MDTKYLLNAFAIILLFMTSSPSMMNEGAFLPFFFLPRRLLISFQVAFGSPLTSSNFFKLYACFACLIIYFRFLRYDTYNWCFCSSSSSGSFIFLWFFLTTLTASRQALNSLCFLFDDEVELFSGAPIRGHVPMLCNLAISIGRPKQNTKTEKMDISNIEWNTWKDDLDLTLKSKLQEGTANDNVNPEFVWKCYKSSLDQALFQHGKKKTSSSHDKVFWTPDLTLLSRVHRDTRKSWNKRNTGDNKEKMDDAKQKFNDARRKACKAYLLERTRDLNTTESHKFWKEFKKLFAGKGSNTVDALNDGDGGLVTDDALKEEILFNTFFKGEHLKDVEFDESFFEKVNEVYTIQYGRPSKLDRGADFPFFCGTATVLTIQLSLQHTRDATPDLM